MFHLTISTWQFVHKILCNVCSTFFLLPFATQMTILVLLKLSYFLSISSLELFGSSSQEGLLKEGLLPLRIFLFNLLNRTKCKSVYIQSRFQFKQIVYISSVMISSTFNIESFLDYLTAEKTVNMKIITF